MRLTTKGLLLIAIPAIFELALLTGLIKAQSYASQGGALGDPQLGGAVPDRLDSRSGAGRIGGAARRGARQ
ncbi:MAG: Phytochrome, two-component sensor histidine kinase (EC [uncultured Paraburkholderia sp.]|nr:MAG: Phytochrome, two-component sensor histidine kinase (EC [uncultured Paraburkholderia sp.]CAH2914362.1 MAG: Phytochrome, two-component sensor histidine kinase (EC [uncultured Paraburkholderia sp.]